MLEKVIFDNTVFNYFLRILTVNLEAIVRSIIRDKVLIPSQIVIEMETLSLSKPQFKSEISRWIDLAHRKRFYQYCDSYDSIVFDNIKRILDDGEAGAIAQAEKTGVYRFISDDIKNLPFIEMNYGNIRQNSIFFLIAVADVAKLLPDYESLLIEILQIKQYDQFSPSKRKQLKALIRNEYIAALQLKGVHYDKKVVSQKTSIDSILKKRINNP